MPDPSTRYVAIPDDVLRFAPDPKSAAVNHLLLGDWVSVTGTANGDWSPVRARGDDGWLLTDHLTAIRPLEINFVDIGQGDGCHIVTPDDRIILIDAGIGNNMARFLSWRYNLRSRKVAGVDGVTATDPLAREPVLIDTVIMSHPDEDHYGGLTPIFENRKVKVQRIFHNGIVERPIADTDKIAGLSYTGGEDIGGYVTSGGRKLLWEVIRDDAELKALVNRHPSTRKKLMAVFRTAMQNNNAVIFKGLSVKDGRLPDFDAPDQPEFAILGPVGIDSSFQGQTRYCLPRLGNEGVTKNGNSVVLRMTFGKLSLLLGGDLNTESEDYLVRQHLGIDFDISELAATAEKLRRKGSQRTPIEEQQWATAAATLGSTVTAGRQKFRVDVAKACHHGSHHFSEAFLQMLDATATIVSSGDDEPYAHPRPDALGAFGKYGRGIRPLIFSTELGRSVRESSPLSRYIEIIKKFEDRIAAAPDASQKAAIKKEMDSHRDRHVAVYGMITLRTDGEQTIIAQKLERPNGNDSKWDIHELVWNDDLGEYEYHPKGLH